MCQDAQSECPRRGHQHEGGSSNTLEIADSQMRHDGTRKVNKETNAARESQGRPPDPSQQAQCASKLTSRQKRKIL